MSTTISEAALEWANSIRFNMVNDPGRKYFADQVETHGFQFLDNYLNEIIEGAGQDAMIELLKTPARAKVSPKKPKSRPPTVSKLKTAQTSDVFGDLIVLGKENSDLHSKKADKEPPSPTQSTAIQRPPLSPMRNKAESVEPQQTRTITSPSVEPASPNPPVMEVLHEKPQDLVMQKPDETEVEQQDLFVIVEDDETADISRLSAHAEERPSPAASPVPAVSPQPAASESQMSQEDDAEMDVTDMLVDEVEEEVVPATKSPQEPKPQPIPSSSSTKAAPPSEARNHIRTLSERDTELDEIMEVPLNDEPAEKAPLAPSSVRKLSSHPLRKSVRATRDTLQPVTPGAGLAGKRTSWLMKLREQKALELPKAPQPQEVPTIQPATSLRSIPSSKRKSGDLVQESAQTVPQDPGSDHKDKKRKITPPHVPVDEEEQQMETETQDVQEQEQAPLQLLKKQVRGLGSKKSSKSLGGEAVANALAEAKAAAQARVAEKEMTIVEPIPDLLPAEKLPKESVNAKAEPAKSETHVAPPPSKPLEALTFLPKPPKDDSVPANPPPRAIPPQPVFTKPVFVAPQKPTSNSHSATRSPPTHFSAAVNVGLSPHLKSLKPQSALSAQSTVESIRSQVVFDDDDETSPAWMVQTQDTEFTTAHSSQHSQGSQRRYDLEEDDSMAIEDEVHVQSGLNGMWSLNKLKEDTWSSAPTESTRTGTHTDSLRRLQEERDGAEDTGALDEHTYPDTMDEDEDKAFYDETEAVGELDELDADRPTVALVQNKDRSTSPTPGGFFSQATKLVSSVWGSNKKPKPEVKSLQLAAAAARKQQEEKDKKATRLKEMEQRRQLTMQKKAEEERARALEEEKKIKEEADRRKREREELTDKRPIPKPAPLKKEDDTKKRKPLDEKKGELKRVNSKLGLNASSSSKPTPSGLKSAVKATPTTHIPAPGSSQNSLKTVKMAPLPSALKGKGKARVPSSDDDTRSKSALGKAVKPAAPVLPPTESIELPDINSEYSDSEDEDRKRTFDPPQWAQSPELVHALQQQSTINPDDIFGTIQPLKMEEIFRSRTSRFRARTSSANWTGADMLTETEKTEYVRRMGYK